MPGAVSFPRQAERCLQAGQQPDAGRHRDRGTRQVVADGLEPTAEAEAGWNQTIAEHAEMRRDWNTTCTPGQYNNEGRIDDKRSNLVGGLYGPGYEYFDLLRQWREDDRLEGIAVTR